MNAILILMLVGCHQVCSVTVVRDGQNSSVIRVRRGETKSIVYNVTHSSTEDPDFLFFMNGTHQISDCENSKSGFIHARIDGDPCVHVTPDGFINELHVLLITGEESAHISCRVPRSINCPSYTDITVSVYEEPSSTDFPTTQTDTPFTPTPCPSLPVDCSTAESTAIELPEQSPTSPGPATTTSMEQETATTRQATSTSTDQETTTRQATSTSTDQETTATEQATTTSTEQETTTGQATTTSDPKIEELEATLDEVDANVKGLVSTTLMILAANTLLLILLILIVLYKIKKNTDAPPAVVVVDNPGNNH